ncbi:MAG: M3 family metallopeptidase [Bacteroidales bacterium]|nr:M3 family metallopeptidase [Bacteroidales bacterium]
MKRYSIIMCLIITTVIGTSCHRQKKEVLTDDNPFFQEWDTPYGVPPFDKIQKSHYLPAFERGIQEQREAIQAICDNTEEPTFGNTIIPYEYSGELLNKVAGVFLNLTECCNDDEMKALSDTIIPMLTKHGDDIMLNDQLFARIKYVYEHQDAMQLNAEQKRLLEVIYKDFVRGGANVPADQQPRFREINEKLSTLTLKFGNNLLDATNSTKLVVDDVKKLKGLTESQLENALETGKKDKKTAGKYVFTLDIPTWEPFLMNCENRELRKEIWEKYANRCLGGQYDNAAVINAIANLRLERAKMLGFDSYAAYVLDDCMAKTPEAVYALLHQVWTPALAKAKTEAADYQKMLSKDHPGAKLEPYDWRYYSEKMRKEKYDLNDEDIRPYFALDTAVKGLFYVCNNLYGITFQENKEIPIYHPDVKAFEVYDGGEVIAIVYMDFLPRESKRSGAWMTNFREQYYTRDGKNQIPIISLVFNFTKPSGKKPSMLNVDQVETLFHEFGHALHSIFSNCHYRTLSGTNVPRDFVEMPSQFMEHFAFEPEVMKAYAHHYKTGEVIPESLIQKISAASTFGQGFINTELLAASLLDMDYHTITSKTNFKLPEFEDESMSRIGLISSIISRYKSPYFQHVFSGGYAAGYYSYTWSAMLDNDAYEAFRENGIFDKTTATSFRTNILEKGNTDDAMKLYVAFRGHEPSIEPLLRNRGLK